MSNDSHEWEVWATPAGGTEDGIDAWDAESGTLTIGESPPGVPSEGPIAWVTIDFDPEGNGDIERLPMFDPRTIKFPCWRGYLPWIDSVGAFNAVPRGEASHPELSFDTRDGVYAVDNGGYVHPVDQPDDPENTDPPEDPDPPDDPDPPEDPEPETIIDDFDRPLSKAYAGDMANYDITTRWGHHSSPSLIHNSSEYVGGLIWSEDGLPAYPERADLIKYTWKTSHGSHDLSFGQDERVYHRICFGMHSTDRFYAASVAVNNERMALAELTPGSGWENVVVGDTRPIPANTRLRNRLGWHNNGNLSLSLYNAETDELLGRLYSTAPSHHEADAGGIGWNHTMAVPECELITDQCWRVPGYFKP